MVSSIELEGGMFKFPLASWGKNCIWAKIAFIYLFLKEFFDNNDNANFGNVGI